MAGELIEHIGILVPDLEKAIARWSAVTGYTFSPIIRYRTDHYTERSNPDPHLHDARCAETREGPPFIELMEIVPGCDTHGPQEVGGIHHIGIRGVDTAEQVAFLAEQGIGTDGTSVLDDGRVHLFFTAKNDLDGVRLEFIAPFHGRTVADDGSALPIDPVTDRYNVWGTSGTAS